MIWKWILSSGVRTYRGNVVFTQGSIRMTCEELVTYFNDDGALDNAVCIGSPAKFKQRPEGQPDDLNGFALEITMDQVKELVTLKSLAKVVQGTSTITGKIITYNLATEKATVKGGGSQSSQSEGSGDAASGSTESDGAIEEDNARPSLVIQPRKKEENVESNAQDDDAESESDDEEPAE